MASTRTYVTPKGMTLVHEKAIGAGQFGVAKLVRSRRGEAYCLKEVSVRTANEEAMQQVVREVDVMKETCNHPNIIAFTESWFERNRLCILMEYCPNSSLDKLISKFAIGKKRFTDTKIVFYMQELANALKYCHHDLRIMHRDLKPANVLIDEIGTLKLGDFGLAKTLDSHTDLCATFCGSPLYMSPEQCSGETYSFSADVWALGCILFELMALQSPWTERTDSEPHLTYPMLIEKIKRANPNYEPLRSFYPDRLIDLTKWMLQPRASKRASAVDIHNFLQLRAPPTTVLQSVCQEGSAFVGLGTKEFASLIPGGLTPIEGVRPRLAAPSPIVLPREEEVALGTLGRQQEIVARAARILQVSFRKSRAARGVFTQRALDTEKKPDPPLEADRRFFVPIQAADADQAPPPTSHDSVRRIQTAFRNSLSRKQAPPTTAPSYAAKMERMTRLQQLAVPRVPPTTRFPPNRRVAPGMTQKKMTMAAPRPLAVPVPPLPFVPRPSPRQFAPPAAPRPAWV